MLLTSDFERQLGWHYKTPKPKSKIELTENEAKVFKMLKKDEQKVSDISKKYKWTKTFTRNRLHALKAKGIVDVRDSGTKYVNGKRAPAIWFLI